MHRCHGVFQVANNLRAAEFHTSITVYCKHLIRGRYGDFFENLIKDVDYLRAKR